MRVLPPEEKKELLLHIPFSEKGYWSTFREAKGPVVATTLTGIALVDGSPYVAACPDGGYYSCYGFHHFRFKKIEDYQPLDSDDKLCAKVRQTGFQRVIELRSDASGNWLERKLSCE